MVSRAVPEDGLDSNLTTSKAVELVAALAAQYQISAIEPFLHVCSAVLERQDLTVAVLGRFKAGKSSFLNHFAGRPILPVGVVPVTSVVTEILFGPTERAEVRFLDGAVEDVPVGRISEFVSEAANPDNRKQVGAVCVWLPELERFRGLRFVDTPGLESAFAHNTEASLAWAPNVDLALVAVGVDPPLSQQDIALIRKLFDYTPKICVLLTKVDVVTASELAEVLQFVREQLRRNFDQPIEVFPYSTRPGFDSFRTDLEFQFIIPHLGAAAEEKGEITARKLKTLLQECAGYLRLTLRSAEMVDAEKERLKADALVEREFLADTKLELKLIARNSADAARALIERTLAPEQSRIVHELMEALNREYPTWKLSFARLLERFEDWLSSALSSRLTELSAAKRVQLVKPVRDVQRQYARALQHFRDRLSERTMTLFGVPLPTTETEIEPAPPKSPDISIGRIFDHNWELLSAIIPMAPLRGAMRRRFQVRIVDEALKNLWRLTAQWDEIARGAILEMQREAERRVEDLVATVERLTGASETDGRQIRADLESVERAIRAL